MAEFIMAYDIGGTFTKFGLFDETGRLRKHGKFASARGDELFIRLEEHVAKLRADYPLSGIGIGVPGLVRDGTIRAAVNLGLINVPMRRHLEEALALPVTVANDANLAAWGEKLRGHVADPDNFILVTIGTGIGSGVILEGHLMEGSVGSFGELGHTVVVPKGRSCNCGNRGCLEQYVSIGGLLENYRAAFGGTLTMGELLNGDPARLAKVLDQSAQKLGLALANAALLLDLRMVLVGGGLAGIAGFLGRIRHWVNYYAMPAIKPIRVDKASLGNDAALYGAYHFHKARTMRDNGLASDEK